MSSWIFWIFSFFTIQEYNIFPFFLVCQVDKMWQEHYVNWVLHLAYIISNLHQCVFTFFCFHNTCCIYSSASVNAATIWWVGGGGEADGDFDTRLDPKLPISPTSSLGPCQSLLTFLRAGRLWRFFCFVFLIHLNLF